MRSMMKGVRTRTGIMIALIVLGLQTISRAAVNASLKANRPWNFIVILLDDAGWRDLGFTGNPYIETPHIDRLAEQGMIFTAAHATHPFSAPSRQSMLTGQWPARTAWTRRGELNRPDMPRPNAPYSPTWAPAWTQQRPEFASIAEMLKSKDYATAHIGKWHFGNVGGDVTPESEGFDVNFGGAETTGAIKNYFAPFQGLPGDVDSKPGEYLTRRLTDETLDFIRANRERPFYVQLWHYAPHTPIMAPEKEVQYYREKKERIGDASLNPTYAAMLDVVDQGVGRVLETLEELGIRDRTVILLSSDNGGRELFGSVPITSVDPYRGEKRYTYLGGLRVPMAIHWPGAVQGARSDLPVCIMDFYPTILDIAGVPLPEEQPTDGISLKPLLTTGRQPDLGRRPLFWYNVTALLGDDATPVVPVAALQRGPWRLVRNFGLPPELYHVGDDPGESRNLADRNPEVLAALQKTLAGWLKDTGIALPTPNSQYDPDYVIPRQVSGEILPRDLSPVREWEPGAANSSWRARRMITLARDRGVLRMKSGGVYPVAGTADAEGLTAGRYAVQVELKVATGGRIRFSCHDRKSRTTTVEFFPKRDGSWHTLTGVFEIGHEPESFSLAAPTHLNMGGHYDPSTQPDYIEVRAIRLYRMAYE
ncbi:sulfatase [Kiritimatiella glycovorans]|uniref:Arylsulfatase n=1 Tax=Kiritimatiella glycovorans TaxID=1307763 RepID=A0A0G3EE42_9BACT|nr:sulfatase [Kiritimatiella glycovorans]AKJ64726.1 Arylsulfatase [Kiritimatiella glycovorans]